MRCAIGAGEIGDGPNCIELRLYLTRDKPAPGETITVQRLTALARTQTDKLRQVQLNNLTKRGQKVTRAGQTYRVLN